MVAPTIFSKPTFASKTNCVFARVPCFATPGSMLEIGASPSGDLHPVNIMKLNDSAITYFNINP